MLAVVRKFYTFILFIVKKFYTTLQYLDISVDLTIVTCKISRHNAVP